MSAGLSSALLVWLGIALMAGGVIGAAIMHRVSRARRPAPSGKPPASALPQPRGGIETDATEPSWRAVEARFQSFINALPDAAFVVDAQGLVTAANPAAQQLFHWDTTESDAVDPARLLRIPGAADGRRWNELLHSAVQNPFADNARMHLQTIDARGQPLSLELWPWRTQLQHQPCLIVVCRDRSELIIADERAAELERQLSRQSAEHAQALATQQMRTLAAGKAKSEFLANMSHELRTPLNVVLGQAHLAGQSATGAQALQLTRISEAAQHLLGLLNDVLEFAEHDDEESEQIAHDTDLSSLLWKVGQGWSHLAEQKGLEFVIWLDESVPAAVRLDEWRVRRVLHNLVGNAVKFTGEGHVTLRLRTQAHVDGTWALRFEVSDSGIGIPPEVLQRLGQPFEQVDASATRSVGGAGLGLAICRRVLGRLDSQLGVSSQPGTGTTFWFDLALVPGAACACADVAESTPSGARRVLVVDPLVDARSALQAHLARLGYAVESAASEAEACLAVGHAESIDQAFDLCLIGAGAGTPPATEQARRIAAAARRRLPQMVLMTCTGGAEAHEPQSLPGPFIGLCRKPTTPARLAEALSAMQAHAGATSRAPMGAAENLEPAPAGSTSIASGLQIAGLHPEIGLRIVRGDLVKYERLLKRFVQSHSDGPDHLRAHAARSQWASVVELAHSLKSTAGAIGALAVSESAAAVNLLSRDRVGAAEVAKVMALASDLSQLLDAIRHHCDSAPSNPGPAPHAATRSRDAQRRDLCRRLRTLIERRDMSPLKYAREHEMMLRAALGASAAPLLQAIQVFDYDQALRLVDRLEAQGESQPLAADALT